MFIGHYAVALGAKKFAPQTSLGTLIAAAAFLVLVWPALVLSGIEQVAVAPGITAFTPLDFVSYPYSHSLLLSLAWGGLFAAVYFTRRRYLPGAIAAGLLVASHWLLDFASHRPDMPLTPWDDARLGLGLWFSVPATLAVETAMFAVGIALYVQASKPSDRIGKWGLAAFLAFAVLIYLGAGFGPPPPSATAVAASGLGQWLFVALAAWIDRHRQTA
jgi:hypothetical protein